MLYPLLETNMPGMTMTMIQTTEESSSNTAISAPLQSFSELSFASIRSAVTNNPWLHELRSEERGLCLIQLLLACANAVSCNNMEQTNACLENISVLASITGDPMQRLSTYFMEALASRITKSWPGLHRALNATRFPCITDTVNARHVFFNTFPYLKFAFGAVNMAIMEAMEGERVVHVIDLDGSQPTQWLGLLQILSQLPDGPPHLKITAINERKEVLQQTATRLIDEAEKLDIPFQFKQIVSRLEDVTADILGVKTGEAVAVSSVLQLHRLLAPPPSSSRNPSTSPPSRKRPRQEDNSSIDLRTMFHNSKEGSRSSYSPSEIEAAISSRRSSFEESSAPIDRFLRLLRGFSPKVVAVVEQDSSHNGPLLMDRFVEALYYYSAVFDSLESRLPHNSMERINIEKYLFGAQIHNIVSCEGAERTDRHEKHERWRGRFERAGFSRVSLGYPVLMNAKALLRGFNCDSYRILEDKDCVTICWGERPIYSVSAWQSL